ncbi:DUF2388 domain-containing protein [Stutzerimonas tarimensis]|uniref:DUF2388 domain-containing protein n=1 Tax=Stutzerimonas tarimensis TaxID=1507735 RepID=A0ABV7T401_9GAMM
MRLTKIIALSSLIVLPAAAMADGFVRSILSSGITTGTTYLTFRGDDKQVVATREDASSFVASEGAIRGPYLEAWLREMRSEHSGLNASDMELATAVLTAQ